MASEEEVVKPEGADRYVWPIPQDQWDAGVRMPDRVAHWHHAKDPETWEAYRGPKSRYYPKA